MQPVLDYLLVRMARCSSLVNTKGIVIQETQNTLRLITTSNRVKSKLLPTPLINHLSPAIPKAGCLFEFTVGEHCFTLHGCNMCFRAADRSARKFKDRPSIEF